MKWRLFLGLFWVVTLEGVAQKFVAEKSVITFFSDALVEDITATNSKTSSLFNTATTEIAFSVPIRQFQFEKKLMQEHFNEKYMESAKFPTASFSGVLLNFDAAAAGPQNVKAKGKLTIHGVTREVEIEGTARAGDRIVLQAKFPVTLADYRVEIPQIIFQNIAETVEVSVSITYKPQ